MNENVIFETESVREYPEIISTAMFSPDFKNNDLIGRTVDVVGYVLREVELYDKTVTGVIFFDEDMNSYSTISTVISQQALEWSKLEKQPDFEKPWPIEFIEKQNGTHRSYQAKIRFRK